MALIESIIKNIPGVTKPVEKQNFKARIKWTAIILILYFFLSEVYIYGIAPSQLSQLAQLAALMGASFGTLMTLGIGPIVTASIMLQLFVGSGIVGWDMTSHEGRAKFQGTQKLLAYIFAIIESAAYTFLGAVQPVNFLPLTLFLIVVQLTLGGWLVILMDEVVSKWGFGSGVSMFIAAGIGKQLFISMFNLAKSATGEFIGVVPALFDNLLRGNVGLNVLSIYLVPIIATLFVFILVVYGQALRVEIPLAFGAFRGFGRKWTLKFIYSSNMPVILTSAVLINIEVWAKLLAKTAVAGTTKMCGLLGCYEGNQAVSGIVHYVTPPSQFMLNLINLNIIPDEVIRVITYTIFMVAGSVLFSIFWVNTSGMDARSVSNQILRSGMQIPGFRRDPRIIESVLQRYITPLAVLGGAFVGLLASLADFSGALVRGTGLLLTVMIIYQMYEQLAMQHLEDMNPMVRKFFEK
ncbi:Protein translocase subunit SecY [uncultured archaeon]|nr:Protein translocase subunit SecY [uncultured archaeon]